MIHNICNSSIEVKKTPVKTMHYIFAIHHASETSVANIYFKGLQNMKQSFCHHHAEDLIASNLSCPSQRCGRVQVL